VRKGCRTLVLSPTRELASQIADSFRAYGKHLRLSTQVVFGGVPVGKHDRAMANGVDILVATPGRLLDLIDRRTLSLRDVEILVLDEADQMLDLGFIHALKRIVTLLPKQRQTLFFSATMPVNIAALADQYLTDPVKVAVTPVATTVERVEQRVMFVATAQKSQLLAHLLRGPEIEHVLVFTRTKHGADKVVKYLDKVGIESAAIHGNKSQSQRERALGAFRAGQCRVLVATDIAARGIDVEGVSHVINFDLPNVPESYVHRIGRTARAGATGIAISFCNGEERAFLRDIERLTRLKVPVEPLPSGFAPIPEEPEAARPAQRQGRPGQRRDQPVGNRPQAKPQSRHGAGRGGSEQPRQGSGRGGSEQPRQGGQRTGEQPRGQDRRPAASGLGEGRQIGWLGSGASGRHVSR
jgi:ATP-dependent RNA helicase RhlE